MIINHKSVKAMKKTQPRFGQQEPKYFCAINPFIDARFSKCPQCNGRTQLRKFALIIHVDPKGIYPTRINCRWCKPCQIIIPHKYDLEELLKTNLAKIAPEQVDSDFLIIGTLDMKTWKDLSTGKADFEIMRKWTSDFLNVIEIGKL